MQKQFNLQCYLDEKNRYVEEFDDENGVHCFWKVEPKDWTPEILKAVVDAGFLDPNEWTEEVQKQAFAK